MKDLTVGKESSLIIRFAVPMLLGGVVQQFYNIADTMIVGKFIANPEDATRALSAVGASFPVFYTLISLVIGLASGAAVVISQYYGAKDMEKVRKSIDTLFITIAISSLIITAVGLLLVDEMFALMQLPTEIIPEATTYLTILIFGLFAGLGYNGISSVLRSLGDSVTPLYFLIVSTIVNIGLDLLFVWGFQWGVAGAAYATVLAQLVSFVMGLVYINRKHSFLNINLLKLDFDKEIFKKSVKIGLPTGLQQMFVSMGMFALFGIVNKFGTNVIAAYSVAGRIDALAIIPAMNFSQALSTFTGQNIGAGRIDRIRKGLSSTMLMSGIFSVVISIFVVIFGAQLMSMFTSDGEVIRIGAEYLQIVGLFYILFTIMFAYTGVFRGAGDTMVTMLISLFSLWLFRIPFSVYFSAIYAEIGIWVSIPFAWAVGMIFSGVYYYFGRWKKKSVVAPPPDLDGMEIEN